MTVLFNREALSTIRRRVGRLMRKCEYGTCSAGAAGSFTVEFVKRFPDNAETLVGRVAYIVSGTGSSQARVITGSTQSTGVATIAPNWTTPPDATSVVEVYGPDLTPEQITDAINQAILHVQHICMTKSYQNPSAIDATRAKLTIPTTMLRVFAFRYEDPSITDTFIEYDLGSGSCWVFRGFLYVAPTIPSDVATANMWIGGYVAPALLSADTDLTDVPSPYLVYMAAYYLEAGDAASESLDPEQHAGRAGQWLRTALELKDSIGTRWEPNTTDMD